MQINAIVAGAGIWGCTVARRLAEAGRCVLVLEKRPVVGGNVRCELTIGGRLGQYKYFDMDKSIQAALEVVI